MQYFYPDQRSSSNISCYIWTTKYKKSRRKSERYKPILITKQILRPKIHNKYIMDKIRV